jgi:hypothetical protein
MSDRRAEFDHTDKSPACGREEHGGCAHVAGPRGGFNPRRLRLELGVGLCPCSCHSSCPVALSGKRMTVLFRTWRESCTCPGPSRNAVGLMRPAPISATSTRGWRSAAAVASAPRVPPARQGATDRPDLAHDQGFAADSSR